MPKINAGVTMLVVGALVCSLPLTGAQPVATAPEPPLRATVGEGTDRLRLVASTCGSFSPSDVLRGSAGRNGATCRPVGLDGEIVHSPTAKADRRDLRNFGRHRVHRRGPHRGTDYRTPCGSSVLAAHSGKVVVLTTPGTPGRLIGVSTGPRRLTTWYGPVARGHVRNGAMVHGGRRIGTVARVGKRGRCHLHFGVHLRGGASDPGAIDPSRWLRRNRGHHASGLAPGQRDAGTFVVATFNVLGHSHTARGGKKRHRFAGSAVRMDRTIGLLGSNHVDIVGLQELQPEQRRMFLRRTERWEMFSPRRDPQDSIAWRPGRFRLVSATTFEVPYFRRDRPMPVVVLRDRATGKRVVVISVHNPASRGRGRSMKHRRAEALRRELRMVSRMARRTDAPVMLLGDFNDKSRAFFCKVTRQGLKASSRGITGRRCRPSAVAGIDWILGTRRIEFLAHQRVQGGLVERITDHPLVLARVRRR